MYTRNCVNDVVGYVSDELVSLELLSRRYLWVHPMRTEERGDTLSFISTRQSVASDTRVKALKERTIDITDVGDSGSLSDKATTKGVGGVELSKVVLITSGGGAGVGGRVAASWRTGSQNLSTFG